MSNQKKDNKFTIDLLSVISNMNIAKEQKEYLALESLNLTKEQAQVVWENDRIVAVRLNESIKTINFDIEVTKDGVEIK